MFPKALQIWARTFAEGAVRPLARRGITPNVVTVVGFVFNVITAGVLATGHLATGGLLLFMSGFFDMLDGALARISSRQSDFGAFLDSLLDRYSEATILLALIIVFTGRRDTPAVLLVYAAAIGSLLISYARARAEGLGLDGKVGIAPRPERVFILGFGLLLSPVSSTPTILALIVLVFLTHATALQRLYHVWNQTRHKKESDVGIRPTKKTETRPT